MEVGLESTKIKSRKLERMSFHENFNPRNFLAIWYCFDQKKYAHVDNFCISCKHSMFKLSLTSAS